MDFSVYREEFLEEWDWIKGCPTGRSVSREVSYKEGIPHEGVHLWIGRQREDRELLFQKRSMKKTLFPGVLDITVAGHVPFGLKEGKVEKEAREELGISSGDGELFDLGYIRFEEKNSHYRHREFQHVYVMRIDEDLDHYSFNDGEVTGIVAVPLSSLKNLLQENFEFKAECYDGKELSVATFSRTDFHPFLFSQKMSQYIEVVLSAMEELLDGGEIYTKMPPLKSL